MWFLGVRELPDPSQANGGVRPLRAASQGDASGEGGPTSTGLYWFTTERCARPGLPQGREAPGEK